MKTNENLSKFQNLINNVEILNQEEYEFCNSFDSTQTFKYLNNIGGGRWLNSNVYSEAEHHNKIHRMECGL